MDRDTLAERCKSLPIFPLPRTVLLPGAVLPLHVFEPRYRALVTHCLASGSPFGIATLKPGYEKDYDDAPAIWPEIGVGEVVSHQPFPDGRCNLVLQYLGQVRVDAELPSEHPFRLISGRLVVEDPAGLEPALRSLKMLVLQLGAVTPDANDEARRLVQLEGMELVDSLARRLLEDPDAQRKYLSATRLVDRVAQIQDRLATWLVAARPVGSA